MNAVSLPDYAYTTRNEAHNAVGNNIFTHLLQCPFKIDKINLNFGVLS